MGSGHSDTSQDAQNMIRKQSHMNLSELGKDEQWARYNEKELALLDRMFQDLAKRSTDNNISKEVFLEFFNLPGILGERLFDVFDTKKDGVINFDEFVTGLARYNRGTLKEKIDMLFEMYALNGQEYITKEQLRVVLFSLVTPTSSIFYSDDPTRTVGGSKRLDPVNDGQNMFRLAERTRRTVNELVDEAFLHLDQENTEKLSRAQFCEWVSRNPAAMEVLNTVFAKHVLDGVSTDENDSTNQLKEEDKNEHDDAGDPADGNNLGAHGLSPDINTPASTNASSPDAPSASPGPTYHSRADGSPPKRHSALKKSTGARSNTIPTALLPIHERLMELHEQEMYEEYYTIFMCSSCGFKFSSSTHIAASQHFPGDTHNDHDNDHDNENDHDEEDHDDHDHKSSRIVLQPQNSGHVNHTSNMSNEHKEADGVQSSSDVLVLEKDGPHRGLTIKFCMQCGKELEKHVVKSENYEQWKNALITRSHYKPTIRKTGSLFKVGRTTGILVERYYVLDDKNLYTFKRQDDKIASDVIFVQGWFIEPFEDHYARVKDKSKQYFGIELQPPHSNIDASSLRKYARTKEERDEWVKILRRAASTGSLDDYYSIGEILGRGHFSIVHLGIHKKTNKKYAIKVVEKKKVDSSQRMSLRNEIAIMKLVKHPYIINMLDVFEDRKMIYMIMALVEHGDLFKRWVEKPGTPKVFSEQVTKIIIWKLLDALQYLHGLGIVHRDLKPENILCTHATDDTQLVISDFGLSKFAAPDAEMTIRGGTVAYVPPEVWKEQPSGREVDVWSLGCIMHLLLRGVLPFDGKTAAIVKEKTLTKELDFTSHPQWEKVSDKAKDLLLKMLIKDPKHRIDLETAIAHPWFADIETEALQINTNLHISSFLNNRCNSLHSSDKVTEEKGSDDENTTKVPDASSNGETNTTSENS